MFANPDDTTVTNSFEISTWCNDGTTDIAQNELTYQAIVS